MAGCKASQPPQKPNPVLVSVGNTPIYASEFEYVYKKNSQNTDTSSEQSIREYLDLYTNFKLKVLEAEGQGLDTLASFKQELEGYKKQLAQPYLTEKSVTENLVREAYVRLQEEVNASHILISLPPEAEPADTLRAYNQLLELRKRALAGEDFGELAKNSSQEPNAATTAGVLGYFTALQMVYPFEDAAYKTPKGNVSAPVRTRFGYHLVKVNDRRPSQGKVRAAHIMVRINPDAPQEDAEAARKKINEIHERLRQGGQWGALCQQFSDDNGSKSKEGELPVFGTGNMISSFEEAAFALQKPGDYTRPVQTPYGWHLIKLLEKIPLESLEELEPTLRQKVSKDSRSDLNRSALIGRLRRENKFSENAPVVAAAMTKADSSLARGTWTFDPADKLLSQTLFTINQTPFAVRPFFDYAKANQQDKGKLSPGFYLQLLYKEYADQQLIAYEESHLEEKYPDYQALVKEYRDGILLFQMMDTKVWSKAITDTLGARAYFEKNQDAYQWGRRAAAVIYDAASQNVLNEAKELLAQPMQPVREPKIAALHFDKNQTALTGADSASLAPLLRTLSRDEDLHVEVGGHADPREKDALAGGRARAAADFLTNQGISLTRIIVKDFGRIKPVSRTDQRKNSRVTFQLYSKSKKAVENQLNANAPLSLQITEGIFQKGENPFVDAIPWQVGSQTSSRDGRVAYVEVTKVEEPRRKTFEEARGLVVADYQNFLEKQWVDELKKQHPVVVNEEEVKKIVGK
ncbi:MAG: peptidylprolyl isomerase [Ferruginibacter sp.]|nr:peptidylprolyl isomerase [Cytophagales bacterium]